MQVTVTTNDEDDTVVYEVPGYPVKVVTEPAGVGEVTVSVWDAAGCHDRQLRPADQAQRVALRTLSNEFRADRAEGVAEVE